MRLPASAPPKRSPGSGRSARPAKSSSPTSPTNCSRNSPAGAAPSTPTPDQTRRPDLPDRQGASARPHCPRTGRCWSIGHKRISGQAAPAHPSGAHRLAARNPADTPDGTGPPVAANPTTRHRIYRSTLVHQPRDLTGLHDLIAIGTHPDPQTEPRPDLAARVRALLRLTTTSVPSCSGLRLTLTRDNLPVTVTALTLDAGLEPVRSSLAIRLPHNPLTNSTRPPPGRPPPGSPQPGSPPPGGELVLYASCRRAFHTVAVDLLTLLDLDPRRAVLDRHLALPDLADAAATLAAQLDDGSAVERAVGVLLARGLPEGQGRQELARRAAAHGHDLPSAARQLLRNTSRTRHRPRTRGTQPRPVTPGRGSRCAPPDRPPPGSASRFLCPHRLSAAAATTVQNSSPLTPVPRCARTVLPASAAKVDLMASLVVESSRQLIVDTQQALTSTRLAVATSLARLSHTAPVLQPAPPGPQARPAVLDPWLEFEAVIDRVARLVIHAQALAERTAALPVIVEPADRHRRADRLHLLRAAVDLGQRAITNAVTIT